MRMHRRPTPIDPPDVPATGAEAALKALRPLAETGRWRRWAGPVGSLVLLAVLGFQLRSSDPHRLLFIFRLHAAFWLTFAALYLAQPLSELVIFRRLWGVPLSGLRPILRKVVLNEVVFGYSGEVYFYAWARRHAGLAGSPFGAVRDVSILSALAGNAVTMAVVAAGAWMLKAERLDQAYAPLLGWAALLVGFSLVVGAVAQRALSLSRREAGFVLAVHLVRLAAATALTLLLWRLALPAVAPAIWVALAGLRLLVSRLPFVTSKELLFANLAALVGGHGADIVALLAALAVMTLVTHLLVIAVQFALDAAGRGRPAGLPT